MEEKPVSRRPTPRQNSSCSTTESFEPTCHETEPRGYADGPPVFASGEDAPAAARNATERPPASATPPSEATTTTMQDRASGAPTPAQERAHMDGASSSAQPRGRLIEPLDERTTRALLEKTLMRLYTPPERLPCLGSPELKLIGRCVSFRCTKLVDGAAVTRCFSGVIGLIGHQSVLLLHVHAFAPDDFARYRRHHRELYRRVRQAEEERAKQRQCDPRVRLVPYGRDGGVGVNGQDQLGIPEDPTMAAEFGIPDGGLSIGASTTIVPPHTFARRGEHHVMGPHFSKTTVGPFSFLALQRRTIRDVRFHLDPSSAWQPLFQDRGRVVNDMQRLRVLVRRYLVYTSVDDNAVHLSLTRFLESRGGFSLRDVCASGSSFFDPLPPLSEALLERIATEELRLLLRLHGDLAVARYQRAAPRAQQLTAGEPPQRGTPSEVVEGIFRHTGVLYATGVPQTTFYSGLIGCGVTLVCAVYLGVAYGVVGNDGLARRFAVLLVPFNVAAVVVWAVCFAALTYCATRMCYPVWDRPACVVARLFASSAAACVSVMSIVACATSLRDGNLRDIMVNRVSHEQLCAYYAKKECSGFSRPCRNGYDASDPLCSCGGVSDTYAAACKGELLSTAVVLSVPMIVIAVVELIVVAYGIYLLFTINTLVRRVTRHQVIP